MKPKACVRHTLSAISLFALAVLLAASGAVDAKSYLVMAKKERIPKSLKASIKAAGGGLVRTIPKIGLAVAESSAKGFATRLEKAGSDVRSVVANPHIIFRIDPDWATAGDPIGGDLTGLQWGLNAIDAYDAWDAGAKGDGVVVAVLDTGIDIDHPDLELSCHHIPGYDFINLDSDPADDCGHGTHVAGIIAAADDGEGVVGVAPGAWLIPIKVLDQNGCGTFATVAEGIKYAVASGADVINLSFGSIPLPRKGGLLPDGTSISAQEVRELIEDMKRIIGYAHDAGVTIVAAAGDEKIDLDHDNYLSMFADINHVIVVSATAPEMWALDPDTDLDVPASYTNYGQSRIHVAAPGGDHDMIFEYPDGWWFDMVLSTDWFLRPGGWGYVWACGTGMAAAHTSGVAALIISRNGGSMDPGRVRAILQRSAEDLGKPGRDDYYGHGRINACRAVKK